MKRIESFLRLGIGLMIIAIANQLVGWFPLRIDLTEEERYSITLPTQKLLESLQEPVYVEVFLEGDMPAGFKRLRQAIQTTLNQFNYYARYPVKSSFQDPSQAAGQRARSEYYRSLARRGLQPTQLAYKEEGKKTEKIIFPGAIVSYFGKEMPVMLLKGHRSASSEERLNQSIEGLEYELANAISILSNDRKKSIAILQAHGVPDTLHLAGLTNALLKNYHVFRTDLTKPSLAKYDAIIFPKPTQPFSEREKFNIDQYLMYGGKALFFVDALRINTDSIRGEGTFAFPYALNLDDMFFRYGVRINPNYVLDVVSSDYPVVVGNMGNQKQIRRMPWPFAPIISHFGNHTMVKNLDAISLKYVSTIDTVKAAGVKKTPLLRTSRYSLVVQAPVKVAYNELKKYIDRTRFNQGQQNVAYLLQGEFTSLYKNRILPKGVNQSDFKAISVPTSVLICADGDLVTNELNLKTGTPLELGVSPYQPMRYANEDLVMNALNFMLNEQGLMISKNKEYKIRPLDKVKAAEEKLQWQWLNLGLPLFFLMLYGLVRAYGRKRKYTRF